MEEISKAEFERMKQNAEERIMRMKNEGLPFPDFVSVRSRPAETSPPPPARPAKAAAPTERENTVCAEGGQSGRGFLPFVRYLNIPEVTQNPDGILLLALILLLSHEGADSALILALAYILL